MISDASSQFKDLHQRCKDLARKAKLLLEHIIGLHCTVQEHQQEIDALKRKLEPANIDHKRLYLAKWHLSFSRTSYILEKMIEVRECTLENLEGEINDPEYSPSVEVEK